LGITLADKTGGAAIVILLVGVIFLAALVPEVVTQVTGVNTSAWNFTGSTGAATLWSLIPFIVIAGYIVKMLVELLG